jgi:chitosanase
MLNELQKQTIQAIVNVFETGKAVGDYGRVTLLAGDAGHLTYGRSQTTLASGNLALLISEYCNAPGPPEQAAALSPFLARLDARDLSLDTDAGFRALLGDAGRDPAMQRVQDEFFDRLYWFPALRFTQELGIATALGTAVVYDSLVHGAWVKLRDRTTARFGAPASTGEREWVGQYVALRREWLATHTNPLLRRCVYRMDAFLSLITAGNWDLVLPLTVHGVLIDADSLAPAPVDGGAAGQPGSDTDGQPASH